MLVAATLLSPPVLGPLEAAGRSSDAAADLVASVLNAWLATRTDVQDPAADR